MTWNPSPLTRKSFIVSGWLAMISAYASLPLAYLAFTLEGRSDTVATMVSGVIQAAGTLLFVALTLILKRFLNRLFAFPATDRCLELMVLTSVVAGVLVLVGICFPQVREPAGIAAMVMMVVQGIVQLRFGYRLLALPHRLGGLLKPYCILTMATGLFVASLVLIPAAVAASAVADLMLATIFFQVADELNKAAPTER